LINEANSIIDELATRGVVIDGVTFLPELSDVNSGVRLFQSEQ